MKRKALSSLTSCGHSQNRTQKVHQTLKLQQPDCPTKKHSPRTTDNKTEKVWRREEVLTILAAVSSATCWATQLHDLWMRVCVWGWGAGVCSGMLSVISLSVKNFVYCLVTTKDLLVVVQRFFSFIAPTNGPHFQISRCSNFKPTQSKKSPWEQ